MRDKRNPYGILVGNRAGKNHVQDPGEDGNDIQIVLKCEGIARTGYIWAILVILKINACSIRIPKISHFKLLIYAKYKIYNYQSKHNKKYFIMLYTRVNKNPSA